MNKLLASALACAALAVPAAVLAEASADPVDVAYRALSEGRTAEALATLDVKTADPAVLINLGTAYARQGRVADARAAFTAAMHSRDHYYLELADGRWVDSRKAAKMALEGLEKSSGIALR